jgi:PAS domain S-box-containing protein
MNEDDELRRRAEALALEKTAQPLKNIAAQTPENIQRVLHELQVHQIELEMQNEELRLAQVQLDIARQRYFDFYNLAPVGYLTLSESGLVQAANLMACKWLELDKNTLAHYSISHVIVKEDQDIFYFFRNQLIASATSQECELRLVKPGGAPFWAHLTGIAVREENDALIIRLVLSDISKRRQNEILLQASEQRFRSFVENLNDVLFVLTPSGMFSYVSPQWRDVFGYELSETVGQPFQPFVHPDDVPACSSFLQTVLSTGEKQSVVEYRVRRKDGSYVWYKANASLIKDPVSNELSVVGIGRDITDHRQMQALRASEERYRHMFDRAGEGILILSTDGKIVAANNSFAQMHGYTVQEILGMSIRDFDSPEATQQAPGRVARMLAGEALVFEIEHYHRDGYLFPLEVSASLIEVNGELLFQSFVRDIFERKLAQADLKKFAADQAQMTIELQSAVDSLRRQSANAEHDLEKEKAHIARELHDELGQLLAAVRMDTELLKMEYGETEPELQTKTNKMLNTLDRALVSMRRAVIHLRPPVLDMGLLPALEWLRDDFTRMFGINCQLSCDAINPKLDNEQLTVVFRITQESLTNVAKHSRAGFVHINAQVSNNVLHLTVQDNGIGFDFDFNQDASRRGLQSFGLQGMRERIMAFNGSLAIDTAPGKGCCVHFSVPVGGGV